MEDLRKKFYNAIKGCDSFLYLINDYSSEGYFFWQGESPSKVLFDSKLSQKSGASSSLVLQLASLEDPLKDFFTYLIERVVADSRIRQTHEIQSIIINEKLFNTTVFYQQFSISEKEEVFYLVAIRASEYLENRNPLDYYPQNFDLATWQCNIQTGELYVNEKWAELLGYSREELSPITFETFNSLTHPKDVDLVKGLIKRYSEHEIGEYKCEVRMLHKSNRWLWISSKGKAISHSKDGKVEWMIGSHMEITERKEREEENKAISIIAEETDYAILMTDESGHIIYCNQAFTNMSGYSIDEIRGKKPGAVLQGKLTREEDKEFFRRNLKQKNCFSTIILNYTKEGRPYFVSCFVNPVINKEGKIEKFISLQRDVTEEKANKEYLETFKTTLDQTSDCIFLFHADSLQFFYVNEGSINMMEYSEDELLQMHPYDIKPHYPIKKFQEFTNELKSSETKSIRFKTYHKTKTEKLIPVEIFLQYINQDKMGPYFVAIVHDISTRLEHEKNLKRLSLVAKNTTNLVVITNKYGKIEYVNEAFERKTEYKLAEIIGKKPGSFLHGPETKSEHIEANRKGIKSLKPFTQEILNYTKSGIPYWVSITFNPVFNHDNVLTNYIAVETDVTRRRALEETLKQERNLLENILNSQSLAVIIMEASGLISYANTGAEAILELEQKETNTKTYHSPNWSSISNNGKALQEKDLPFAKVFQTRQPVKDMELGVLCSNYQKKYLSITGAPFRMKENSIESALFSMVDITDRIKAQKQLASTRKQMESIISEISDVVWSVDLSNNKLVYITPSIEKISGLSPSYYYENFHMDGWDNRVVEEDKGLIEKINKELLERRKFEVEYRIMCKSGQTKWISNKGKYIYEDKIPVRLDGLISDISKRKKNEKDINEYISIIEGQNERLRNFTYIVSHNLRSHSSNISGLLDLINQKYPTYRENKYFDYLNLASEKLEDTLHHLNDVVSVVSSRNKMETINLYDFVTDFRASFQNMLEEESVCFITEICRSELIHAVPAFLDSIITNLVSNAIRYRNPDTESYVKLYTTKANNEVVLCVEDNGLGLDLDQYGNKIFGLNKTFHNNKDAKGIGLFLVKNQIESMGGKISVESKQMVGSTFKIHFRNAEV